MRHLTCAPTVEIIGFYIRTYVDNLQSDDTRPIIEKHGLVNLPPDQWYRCDVWMEVLNEMAQYPNFLSSCVAIGMKVGEMVPVPPDMTDPTLEKVLMAWDAAYKSVHRNGDVGGIRIEKVNDKHFKTIHTVLYPDDMSYGVLYAYGRRFLPPKTQFKVYYDPEIPARDYGGKDETIIHIEWQ